MENVNNNDNEGLIFKRKISKNDSSKSKNLAPLENTNSPKQKKDSSKTGIDEESIDLVLNSPSAKYLKMKTRANQNKVLKSKQMKNLVFSILLKDSNTRTNQEVLIVANYLSKNYKYFINLKKNDSQQKINELSKICKLEKFHPGDTIILYGDIGDKFYIVLEGQVEIYIPEYYEKEITPYEYLEILDKIRRKDKLKYERVKSKNNRFTFETFDINKVDKNTTFMKSKFIFILENEEKKGQYGEGFSFGEIALIKKTTRNATIKSMENTFCLSISKNDYNEVVREIDTKKLIKEIDAFKQQYQFFNCFNNEKMIKIFNCFSRILLNRGDYLYHQNDINDYIYLVVKGNFEVYSYISYSWLNEYYDYIDDSLGNILFYMISNHNLSYTELEEVIKNIKKNINPSPMNDLNKSLADKINMITKKNMKDNLYLIKNDEEQINNDKNVFRINLNKSDCNDIYGLEDCFDFKRKFYSVKCISNTAELKCIKVTDLIRIIWNSKIDDYFYILKLIMNKKNILKNKIINYAQNLEKKILFDLDSRYENLINYKENIYNKKENTSKNEISLKEKIQTNFFKKNHKREDENEINKVISTLKVKGYKTSIQEILDKRINILPSEKSKEEKKLLKINNTINNDILKNLLKSRKTNHHIFKFKKVSSHLSFNSSETKNNSFLSYPYTNKNISSNYTSFKKNNIKNLEFSGLSNFNAQSEDISNSNLENNISRLTKNNNLKESMSLLDKIVKTPNNLNFSTKFGNKKVFLYKKNKNRKSKNNQFLINKNPVINFLNIEKPRLNFKSKSNIFSSKINLNLIKKSNSIDYSQNIYQNISQKSKIENKRRDIFNTMKKEKIINNISGNKTQNEENSLIQENIQKYFYNKRRTINPIRKNNSLIKKDISFNSIKKLSFQGLKSSIFNK